MLKFEKVEVSGIVVLFVGVILLVATFYSAFMFLVGDITVLTSADLAELFGNALSPLIAAVIHVLYLGVMGWMGSVMTIRAVQLLKKEKEKEATPTQPLPKAIAPLASTQTPAKNEPQKDNKETRNQEIPQKAPAPVPQPPAAPQQESKEKAPEKPLESVAA